MQGESQSRNPTKLISSIIELLSDYYKGDTNIPIEVLETAIDLSKLVVTVDKAAQSEKPSQPKVSKRLYEKISTPPPAHNFIFVKDTRQTRRKHNPF